MADTEDLPTLDEVVELAQDELRLAVDPQGRTTVNLTDGSRNTALVSMQTGLAMRVVRYAADREAASRASTAEEDDLDTVARDFYGEERKEEAFARGAIRLQRGAGRPAGTIPRGTRFAVPAAGASAAVVFEARETVAVASGDTEAVVPLRAIESGASGNLSDPNLITQILDTLPDTTWEIGAWSDPDGFAGGDERESDATLRARLLQIGTEDNDQRGTYAAIVAGALRVRGVRYAVAVEPRNGTVVLFVGDAGYALNEALAQDVRTELLNWRCFGVAVDLRPFTVSDVAISATVHMARGLENYDLATIAAQAEANLLAYFDARPYPDEYYLDRIQGALGDAHEEVQHVALLAPLADVQRPADTTYASTVTLTRYRVLPGTLQLTFAAPLTV